MHVRRRSQKWCPIASQSPACEEPPVKSHWSEEPLAKSQVRRAPSEDSTAKSQVRRATDLSLGEPLQQLLLPPLLRTAGSEIKCKSRDRRYRSH
eukprot:1796682-Rhodomonas_salina.1